MTGVLKCFTAVKMPLQSTADVLAQNLKRFGPVSRVSLAGSDQLLQFLGPLKTGVTRFGCVCAGEWTILMTDMRGENCFVDGFAISRKTRCAAMSVKIFHVIRAFQLVEDGAVVREVCSCADGDRWHFFELGALQPFEDVSENSKRRKRDRLSIETVTKYFEVYTGMKVPDWETLANCEGVGIGRSLKDVQVPILHFATDLE